MPNDSRGDQYPVGPIRCSFCGKGQDQVRKLVKGPTDIFICDECVAACVEILEEALANDFMTSHDDFSDMMDAFGIQAPAGEAAEEPEMHREEPLTEESLLSDIDAMLEEQPEEEEPQEEQPEKKRRRFWPFGRKRDEE